MSSKEKNFLFDNIRLPKSDLLPPQDSFLPTHSHNIIIFKNVSSLETQLIGIPFSKDLLFETCSLLCLPTLPPSSLYPLQLSSNPVLNSWNPRRDTTKWGIRAETPTYFLHFFVIRLFISFEITYHSYQMNRLLIYGNAESIPGYNCSDHEPAHPNPNIRIFAGTVDVVYGLIVIVSFRIQDIESEYIFSVCTLQQWLCSTGSLGSPASRSCSSLPAWIWEL